MAKRDYYEVLGVDKISQQRRNQKSLQKIST